MRLFLLISLFIFSSCLAFSQNISTNMRTNGRVSIGNETEGYYVGKIRNGKKHSQGTFLHASGMTYKGKWKNDEMHGKGTMTFSSGAKVQGTWIKGKINGYVVYTYPNGDVYKGQMRDNKKHGKGTCYYANGEVYKGYWENGYRHGEGRLITQNQKVIYDGRWEKGKKCLTTKNDPSINDNSTKKSPFWNHIAENN